MQVAGGKIFSFGEFTLDLRRGRLCADDREIELRPKSFEVLRYLVENAGRLVPKDEIIKAVWPNVTVTDESLTRCVSDIRLALKDIGQSAIRTVTRRGYVFEAPVSIGTTDQAPDENAARPRTNDVGASAAKPQGGRFSLVVLPFVNLSGGQDHLADAITEGLTTYLSRIRDAFIIARSIAMTYKGSAVDVRRVGRELGVRYVLEGSEQHTGSLVRVSAQ
jgi:DNA-binding winged helix-turn-helix (wHTH) protein